MQLFTSKMNELAKSQESTREEFRKLFEDRDKAIRTLAERTKTLSESIGKLEQGIPSNPMLESAIKDLPVLKAQMPGVTNRLGTLEKTVAGVSENIATLLSRLETIDSMPASSPVMGQGQSSRPGWGSRNIQTQIEGIGKDLVRALPKELQSSAETALKQATKAFMNEFVKNFSQGLKPTKFPQPRTATTS
jgi:seryl-tRNA synthetase